MAKQTAEKIETQDPVLKVQDFVESPKKKPQPVLKRGEVLVAELDDNGKEVNHFISNQATFDAFYSKNKKFSIKKK